MASHPLDTGLTPNRAAALVAGTCGLAAALLVLWIAGSLVAAIGFLAASIILGGGVIAWRMLARPAPDPERLIDWSLARAVAEASRDAVAVTDRAGRLVCANDRYEALFGGFPTPPSLPLDSGTAELGAAGRAAWRDGTGAVARLAIGTNRLTAEVVRAGEEGDMLVWRFPTLAEYDAVETVTGSMATTMGDRLGSAGIMMALIAPDGRVLAANRVLSARALGRSDDHLDGRDFARFLITDDRGLVRFEREGLEGNPLRLIQVPFVDADDAPVLIALLDEEREVAPALGAGAGALLRHLVGLMPLGVALVDRDGRFVQMNDAFVRAAGASSGTPPLYPGDLVVREDKAAVADAIRRFASGASHSADMAIRLKTNPEEPVALTIAGARGLGDAAVLLSLKDNSEESRLKREVAQATKMQAVGQLAGGVAHDFNNILTAIIGHCDLMLMRHSPGDSDYDDIQQIRTNSNRAAGLTRQLLAFSRQQTLRPQILQLPDVVSEVSNLLKRLLGETVKLDVTHGRNLGPVRADPGQLEQVVVNLAVNARDAMLGGSARGGGTLTIQTRSVSAAEVRRMGTDIMPPADYTALIVTDTGTGIPAEVLPKIFEPFFTTKEVGKGTGLGLSTVYGIVKQSGGYIFADSRPNEGATFSIYLPVHAAAAAARTKAPKTLKPAETWGSGTVLLVEDEDMVRTVAERALARQGYSVLTAENGEAALELLSTSGRPDLLISDVVMPAMDGPTMVRKVRAQYPDLPILFMSGYAEEQLRKSIDLDNVSFLPKPFSVQQLAEATRDALSGR
ncbi:two-component system, cell cycle sensor histidine kinase and response regulator CckA [Sphingomonas gellani]|uniref:histidine kinase n=1 Tax=Sphingomonas gellani TaxID=1166340 RepID=A0A1H7ZSW6_9SPHN|nr:PAS domain-containing sensor histidine kinase [Sphingomonas gellani]SEM61722.1 two-component system, cell cycle sensor histidine kinase and response regulator CckA [Sphingomonas gellani]